MKDIANAAAQGGRNEEAGIGLEKDTYSVVEFIRLTKDAYGGEMIRKLVAD